jgi:excinuclease UvrABC ATPase subunit
MDFIRIRGARTHNLKNVSLDLPRDKMIVITGLSGSGKSSLAFDTLYAEGQRRYVESLSAYARQFLARMDKPDVDLIEAQPSRSNRNPLLTTRVPRSAPSPKSTTTCACSTPAPATRSVRNTASSWKPRPFRRWSTACWRCRKKPNS